MKKIATMLLLLCCFFMNTAASASIILEYDGGIRNYTGPICKLYVNDKELTDLPLEPIIFNDRALVPVREVFEALGATVTYSVANQEIQILYGKKTVKIWIDKVSAIVNGLRQTIPDNVAPKLIKKWGDENSKTMVPVRFVSERIGLDVKYVGEEYAIYISGEPMATPKPTKTPKPSTNPRPAVNPSDEINDVVINKITVTEREDVVTVKVTTDGVISKLGKPALTGAGVLFADVYGASYTCPNRKDVEFDAVTSVRLGMHEEYTRIAIDTIDVEKYSVALSTDKKSVIFKLSQSKTADMGTPEPTAQPTAKPSTSPTTSPTPSPTPKPIVYSSKKYVVIDAGHGGYDSGASGYLMTEEELSAYDEAVKAGGTAVSELLKGTGKEYREKNIALNIAKMVQENLEANSINVIMTRDGDTYPELTERTEIANDAGAVMFVSIHLNSTVDPVTTAKGIEVYYSKQNNEDDINLTSYMLADYLMDNLIDHTDAARRGVKSGNLLVNRKCQMPSTLVEVGFMNNPYELENMIKESYQEKVAAGITQGILAAMKDVKLPKNTK